MKRRRVIVERYDGEPYINLCLAILNMAQHDCAKMWKEWRLTDLSRVKERDKLKRRLLAAQTALWVGKYITDKIKEY